MATILELAEFSDAAYETKSFVGWQALESSDALNAAKFADDGYFGQAYQNIATGEIVIANRGTRPTSLKDLLSDLELALNESTAVQEDAVTYALFIANDPRYSGFPIIETGHSLGGNEAQAATVALTENQINVSAIIFNSPGIGGYPVSPGNYNVLNLYNQGDAIHMAGGAHLGTSQILPAGPDTSKLLFGLPAAVALGPVGIGAWLGATLYNLVGPAHSILTTIDYLRTQNPVTWPTTGNVTFSVSSDAATIDVNVNYSAGSLTLTGANNDSGTFTINEQGNQSTTWSSSDGTNSISVINTDGSSNGTTTRADGTSSTYSNDGHGNTLSQEFDSHGIEIRGFSHNADGSFGFVDTFDSATIKNTSQNDGSISYAFNLSGSNPSDNTLLGRYTSTIGPNGSGNGESYHLDGKVGAEWNISEDGSGSGIDHYKDGSVAYKWDIGADGSISATAYREGGGVAISAKYNAQSLFSGEQYYSDGSLAEISIESANGGYITTSYGQDGSVSSSSSTTQPWAVGGSIDNVTLIIKKRDIFNNTDGTTIFWGAPDYDACVSLSYSPDGNIKEINVKNIDYSGTGATYQPDGSIETTFKSSNLLSPLGSRTKVDADGTFGVYTSYQNSIAKHSHDSDGVFTNSTVTSGGNSSTLDITTSSIYRADGSIYAENYYDVLSSGQMYFDIYGNGYNISTSRKNADGSTVAISSDGKGDFVTVTYRADGSPSSEEVIGSDGTTRFYSYNSDGQVINWSEHNALGIYTMDESGTLSETIYNTDGSYAVKTYGSQGNIASSDNYDRFGNLGTKLTYHTGGSYSSYTDDKLGKTITTNFDANNIKLSDTWNKSDGSSGSDTFNADGSSSGITYILDGSYSTYANYGQGDTLKTNYDANGVMLSDNWTKADGYSSTDIFNADGSSSGTKNNVDGSYSSYTNDGHGETITKNYDFNGSELGYSISSDDGNDNDRKFITINYDASGIKLSDNWFKADDSSGNDTFNEDGSSSGTINNTDGGYSTYINDGQGNITTTNYVTIYAGKSGKGGEIIELSDSWIQANGSTGSDTFNADGSSSGTSNNLDGSYSSYTNDGQGDTFKTNYDANDIRLSDNWTKADGSSGIDTFNVDGSSSGTTNNLDGSYSTYTNDGLGATTTTTYDANGTRLSSTVLASVDYTLPDNVENLTGSGSADLTLTGNSLNNIITANSGNVTLIAGIGIDVLQGGTGHGTLRDLIGQGALLGGADNDIIAVGAANDFIAGGAGNDSISIGSTSSVIAFNSGDGQDTITTTTGASAALSLGGGIDYSNLTFSKNGNDLILNTGGTDAITIQGWYASTANHDFVTLQVLEEASATYNPNSANTLYNQKIEEFNFGQLVTQFDQARAVTPDMAGWNLMNGLLDAHLSGSDSAALGGDLAYYTGTKGSLTGLDMTAAVATLQDPQFGKGAQTIHSWNTVSQSHNALR